MEKRDKKFPEKKKGKLKKILITSLIVLAVILIYTGLMIAIVPNIDIIEEEYILGAHRGNSIYFMENTLPAFQSAIEEDKYKFIEFDVQYTKDKIIVVHHDQSLLRLQKKLNKIEDLTYEELLNISDYHIPTYEEVMSIVAGVKPLDIEIKSQGNFTDDKNMVDFLIKDLKEKEILDSTIISSISHDVVRYINFKYEENFCLNCKGEYENCVGCERNINYNNTKLKTGIIYYVHPETFLQAIYPNSLSMVSSMVESGANFLMIHGVNLRSYKSTIKSLPENTYLVLWYFTDEMYLVVPKIRHTTLEDVFGITFTKEKILKSPKEEPCLWWCGSEF